MSVQIVESVYVAILLQTHNYSIQSIIRCTIKWISAFWGDISGIGGLFPTSYHFLWVSSLPYYCFLRNEMINRFNCISLLSFSSLFLLQPRHYLQVAWIRVIGLFGLLLILHHPCSRLQPSFISPSISSRAITHFGETKNCQ